MLINLVGLLIAFSIVIHIWIIISVYKQNIASLIFPLFIYLNGLLLIVEFTTLFLLQKNLIPVNFHIFKIRIITQSFIPPLLFHITQTYSLSNVLPRFTFKNIFLFGISLLVSGLTIGGLMIKGKIVQNGVVYPEYTSYYWLFILYFYAIFYIVLMEFIRKYRLAKRREEIENLKHFLNYIIPAAVLVFSAMNLLPFWGYVHPLIFLGYPLFTGIILNLTFRFNLLDYNESVSKSIYFFLISVVYFLILLVLPFPNQTLFIFISIPLLILVYLVAGKIQSYLTRIVRERNIQVDYNLEEELENLISDAGSFIDEKNLAHYLGEFSQKVLRCQKCAILTSRFDVHPFHIAYNQGFAKEHLEEIISGTNSLMLEPLALDGTVLNKFDHDPRSSIYQKMERYNMYLGIPLITQNNLMGLIFLGGDRKTARFLSKDLRFTRFISVQAANALQNVRAIQSAVQSQKMAALGEMASQLAHDFQSFISLVKLETSPEMRIRNHANYMEKLVQDLLNYARPQELKLTAVSINQLLDMTLDLVNIPSNIVVEKHYSDSIPEIKVDSNQLRRAFLNLFENSVRAMKNGGGRLKITTRPLRPLSKVRPNPWIYIEILDEGAGIPEEFLDKVFEPFFTTRKHEGGSGMGLAIAKKIITRHKGFIDVTSKLNKGTILNIRLPYLI